jgi:hypothetical protein
MRHTLLVVAALALVACGSRPPAPDWQVAAHGALQRYAQAYLTGQDRAADAEFARARSELGATGQAALVARAELTRCALQVATLAFEPCTGFESLRADAPAAERAYAGYLAGERVAADLLPAQHRAALQAGTPAAVAAIDDPVARLVAAGVLVRSGRATPQLLQVAADTASAQGWRRPLLAWLGAQLRLAEQAGAAEEAARLRRRIGLVSGPG